ncbi:Lrp/AsnC family transcriptional regulator [Croceitalea rosinachiae]|uniref:Lrp/AsnC family transcriptional regulator n=1 Tax=Croceitalea rosinachiae TaxID=3075596 RepID=A0ABU3AE63_9FLAO|nr:Lrp/AsnC family transcriptional regulator [Croceitalea sp. F388]MDT0608470.1 Lrp/AsnC family transcriptional regulator [Croceitalea sp. F388]
MKIDEINWKILQMLQENARVALKDLAKEVGLSSPTVAERIQKMEDAGVIESYNTKVNLDKLGYSLGVYITIKIRFGQTQRFEEFILTVPEISECHKLTGRDCMLLRGVVRDPKHLEELNVRLAVYGELTTSLILNSVMDGKIYCEHF